MLFQKHVEDSMVISIVIGSFCSVSSFSSRFSLFNGVTGTFNGERVSQLCFYNFTETSGGSYLVASRIQFDSSGRRSSYISITFYLFVSLSSFCFIFLLVSLLYTPLPL